MSKNTQISELINYLSVDGSGNIVITGSLVGPAGATYATQSYVTTAISNLVNAAPTALDTLAELSTALNNDASFATTVTNSLAGKLNLSGGTLTGALVGTSATFSGSLVVGGVAAAGNSHAFYNTASETSVLIKQTSASANATLALWNNFTSGDNSFIKFFTEGTATARGTITYDRANNRLAINGAAGGLTFTGAATFSSYLTANGYYVPNTAEQGFATLNGSNGMLVNGTSGYVVLMSGGNETIYLSNTGKVGIGTTSPSVLLQLAINGGFPVLGTNHTSSNLFLSSANRLWGMYFGLDGNSGTGWIQQMRNDGATAYPIILQPVGGNVGIGLTTPYYKLHVQDSTNTGTIAIGHNSYPGLIYSSAVSGEFRIDNRSSANAGFITFYPNGEASTIGNEAMRITSSRNIGIGTTSPSHKLQVSGNIYSTDTVFGRNLKPEGWASVSAGSPSSSGIPLGYSSINISSLCDNNWRTILSNINDTKVFMWVTLGDAASKDTASYTWQMTSPAYGVANFGQVSYLDGGWNTGGFEFVSSNANGTYNLMVRCTSYYNSGNTAYGNIYFLRIE